MFLPNTILSFINVFCYEHTNYCSNCFNELQEDIKYTNIVNAIYDSCETDTSSNDYDDTNVFSNSPNELTSCFDIAKKYKCKHRNNLVFAHLNVNSLKKKHAEIHLLVSGNIDVMFLSETKLDNTYTSSMFAIENYSIVRQDRSSRGGGLLVYIRSDIINRRRFDIEYNNNGIECICLEVVINTIKNLYVLIYKPPNVNDRFLVHAFESINNMCQNMFSQIIFIGDMNCNMLLETNVIYDFMLTHDFHNLVKHPTCFKATPSLLDVIISNCKGKLFDVNCVHNSISDFHSIVIACTRCHVPDLKPRSIKYRSLKHFDPVAFNSDLALLPTSVCEIFDDVDDCLWVHNQMVAAVIDRHAPIKTKTLRRPQLPYMNSNLRKNINIKEMLRRKSLKCNCKIWPCPHRVAYNKKRNEVRMLKTRSLNNYINLKCSNFKSNPKDMWNTINPLIQDKSGFSSKKIVLSQGNDIINDDNDVCEMFNTYYVNVTDTIGNEAPLSHSDNIIDIISEYSNHPSILQIREHVGFDTANNPFNFRRVTSAEIKKKLNGLNVRKATGYDEMPARFLKLGANVLCHTLQPLLNRCLINTVYPDCLKPANVSPIFKSGDSLNVAKYRPVSVLPALSKVFEGTILDQAADYAYENVLSTELCAYRARYCCQDILLKFVEETKLALDSGEISIALATDLSLAFDCLPHRLLLAKAHAYGFSSQACQLFHSYLLERKQRVKLNNSCSSWLNLKRGVPQGSLVGPFMYNLFINDFLYTLFPFCTVYNYADDNTLVVSGSNLISAKAKLEVACTRALEWFSVNHMKANPAKFQAIIFSKSNIAPSEKMLPFLNTSFVCQPNIKLLGVYFDEKLSFNYHVREMCKKAGRIISSLYRLKNKIEQENKMQLYYAFIISNITYCSLIWHFCGIKNTNLIEKINERGLRFVRDDFRSEYHEMLSLLNRPTMLLDRQRQILVAAYKSLNQVGPAFLHEHINVKPQTHNLRGGLKLILPKFNSVKYGKRSILYELAYLWNKLPNHFKECLDVEDFKCMIQKWENV